MTISRFEAGKIQKSAWLSRREFLEKLKFHLGEDIKMRWGGGKNQYVTLLEIHNDIISIERAGKRENVSLNQVDGFTAKDEWYNQRKGV